MHFLIRETLSFNLMHVAACYPVGTTISKTSPLFTALLQHYKEYYPLKRIGFCSNQKMLIYRFIIKLYNYLSFCLEIVVHIGNPL